VILGDNIIEKDIAQAARAFEQQDCGAKILLKEVSDPERFGVPVFENGKIIRIEEKPKKPQSHYAVTGIYFYDATVFERIRPLKPSARGELEISDVNNVYIERGEMTWDLLDGWWTDAGTFDSLLLANQLVSKKG
jgi:glucose-1-phosphate thymidylyltransferase